MSTATEELKQHWAEEMEKGNVSLTPFGAHDGEKMVQLTVIDTGESVVLPAAAAMVLFGQFALSPEQLALVKAVKEANEDDDEIDWDKYEIPDCGTPPFSFGPYYGIDGDPRVGVFDGEDLIDEVTPQQLVGMLRRMRQDDEAES